MSTASTVARAETSAAAGLGSGRLYSINVSGVPNPLVLHGGLVAEIVSLARAFVVFRKLTPST